MNPTLRSLPAAAGEVGSLVEVLGDETIGGYEVTVVTDGVAHMILRGIEQFCNDVRPHDQVLVYFSCHGMLDGLGKLYFAATDTEPTLLGATAVESDWVMRQLDGCRSRCQILMLDCCYSGASVMGAMNDAEPPLITRVPEVAGRCVLTASRPREYAFDGVFTGAVVNGLRTGDADYDGDGLITPAELFGYVETCARASAQGQNPTFSIREAQGQIPLAYSPRGPMSTTMSPPLRGLPPHVLVRLNRPEPRVRIGAVAELEDLASTDLRPLALDELKRVASQDIRRVAQVAEAALTRAAAKGGPRPELDRKLIIGLLGAIAVIGAAVLALINSGGQPVSASLPPPPVVVGAMYPTDAASKTAREQIVDGEQFAVDYINNRDDLNLAAPALRGGAGLPGLRGARLKLAPVPSGTACEAGAAFDKLVDDYHPVAVLGAYESTVTLQAIVAADRRRVPLVNESATAPQLTPEHPPRTRLSGCGTSKGPKDPRPSPWFFRVAPNDRQAADQFFTYIADKQAANPGTPLAILYEGQDLYGNGAARAVERSAPAFGQMVKPYKYPTVIKHRGGSSLRVSNHDLLCNVLRGRVGRIKAKNPSFVFAASYLPDAVAAVQTMKQLGYPVSRMLTFGAGFVDGPFLSDVTKHPACPGLPTASPNGIVTRVSWSRTIALRTHRAIVDAYERRFGTMTQLSAAGFTAMMTLAQAIDKAHSRDRGKIKDALGRLQLPSAATINPWCGVKFDRYGQNTKARVVLQEIRDRRYVDLSEPDLTTCRQ